MNYHTIFKDDLINGDGVRVSLFVSGCSHGCLGCYSESTWDYRSGTEFTDEVQKVIFDELSKNYVDGLSLLGGDPLAPKNYNTVLELCKKVRLKYPSKTIWCWSGYTLEQIQRAYCKDILNYIDVLVDGRFVEELKDLSLPYRGSSNQRILHKGTDF